MLRHLGYAAVVAEDGRQALGAARGRRFDAVLMDMPDAGHGRLPGHRARCAGSRASRRRTPIIAMTAARHRRRAGAVPGRRHGRLRHASRSPGRSVAAVLDQWVRTGTPGLSVLAGSRAAARRRPARPGRGGTSASGNQRASSVVPSTSWRSCPPVTVASKTTRMPRNQRSPVRRCAAPAATTMVSTPEQPAELDVVPGLLAHLAHRAPPRPSPPAPRRRPGRVQRARRPRSRARAAPGRGRRRPRRSREPAVVVGVVQHGAQDRVAHVRWPRRTPLGMNRAPVGYGQV